MEKPIVLVYNEFKQNLYQLINEALYSLPAFLVDEACSRASAEVREYAVRAQMEAQKEYEQSLEANDEAKEEKQGE